MAAMYAVYHGPRGLRSIAERVHMFASKLAKGLQQLGFEIAHEDFFDTLHVDLGDKINHTSFLVRLEKINSQNPGPNHFSLFHHHAKLH